MYQTITNTSDYFYEFVVRSHLHVEVYFNEHTSSAAFCINLNEPMITYISSSDFLSHSVLIISLKNTQLSSKTQPQSFEIQKVFCILCFPVHFFTKFTKVFIQVAAFGNTVRKGSQGIGILPPKQLIKYTATPFYLCKHKSNYLSIYPSFLQSKSKTQCPKYYTKTCSVIDPQHFTLMKTKTKFFLSLVAINCQSIK